MCGERFAFWLFIVLLFTLSSTTPRNLTSDNKEDNIWQETYNHTNFIKNKINNDNNKNYIVSYEECRNITCIQLCCPLGDRLVDENCIASENEYVFPNIYSYSNNSIQSGNKKVNELFPLTVQNQCQETTSSTFHSYEDDYKNSELNYMFFANGSLYLPHFKIFVESASYCLAVMDDNQFNAIICSAMIWKKDYYINTKILNILYWSCRIVSILCLLTTFVVYSILPELRNIHSFILRQCCSMLFFGWISDILYFRSKDIADIPYFICVIIALVRYFCLVSWSFWLSVLSFNFWWTFRDFRLLQRNEGAKQTRKKLIYSIFAWGTTFIFTIICIIMDFVPNVPKNLIRPEFCDRSPGFTSRKAYLLYFYGPRSVCIISSICLSICTALKIIRYEKDTARHLRDSENRVYNDNKRWFGLYLRLFIILFIIMAINWITITVSIYWPSDVSVWFSAYYKCNLVLNAMQDIGTFIIFVCKKTIMRQLLKRFCQNCKCFSKNST